MGSHPLNLAFRFILELTALTSYGLWGWRLSDSWIRFLFAIGIPLIAGAIWGIFAVPQDPSRSGSAPIPVPGIIRLMIELLIFGLGAWALHDIELITFCWLLAGGVIIHYSISYDRVMWLISI